MLIFVAGYAITSHKVAEDFGAYPVLSEQTPSERGTPNKWPSYRVPAFSFNTTPSISLIRQSSLAVETPESAEDPPGKDRFGGAGVQVTCPSFRPLR